MTQDPDEHEQRARIAEWKRQRAEAKRERERQIHRLMVYRGFVGRMSIGGALSEAEGRELHAIMDALTLPAYAVERDVKAVISWQRADHRDRAALWNDHPHLFEDAEEWYRSWQSANDRRRQHPHFAFG